VSAQSSYQYPYPYPNPQERLSEYQGDVDVDTDVRLRLSFPSVLGDAGHVQRQRPASNPLGIRLEWNDCAPLRISDLHAHMCVVR
jgi:hypothetical protein